MAEDAPLGKVAQGQLLLWDYNTGEKLWVRQVEEVLTSVLFSPDDTIIATSGCLQGAYLWDAKRGQQRARFAYDEPPKEEKNAMTPNGHVMFSRDGSLLAWGGENGVGHIWKVGSGAKVWSTYNKGGFSNTIVFSPDGKLFVSSSEKHLAIWDVASRKQVGSIPVFSTVFRFSPDGTILAVGEKRFGEEPDALTFWDVSTRRKIRTCRGGYPSAFFGLAVIAFSPDGKRLAWAETGNHSLHLLDVTTGEECAVSRGGQGILHHLAYSPDGKTLALGGMDHSIYLWDLSSLRLRKTLSEGRIGAILGLAFSPDGRRLVGASEELHFWDPRTGTSLRPGIEEQPLKGGGPVFFSPDGHLMITRSESDAVYSREAKTGQVLQRFRVLDYITALALSSNGRLLAAGADDGSLPIWDLDNSKEVLRLSGERGQHQAIAFSPDNNTLAVGGERKRIRVWELWTGKLCLQLSVTDDIHCLAFSPCGRFLASSGPDKVVSLWDLATRKAAVRLSGHQGTVSALGFSPDGNILATASEDTTALLWHWREAIPRQVRQQPPMSSHDLRRLWKALASPDARIAYKAIWTLAAVPDQTVPMLREHITPIAIPDASRVARLIADLNSDNFAARNHAMRDLQSMEELVELQLRKAMSDNAAPETRRNAKELLDRLQHPLVPGDKLRSLRALVILEQSKTAASIKLLQELAKGAPGARLTREAQAALSRLTK